MVREVRRVPADWEHPRRECPHSPWQGGCSEAKRHGDGRCYQPLYDQPFRQAADDWKQGYEAWNSGADPDKADHPDMEFWEWESNPPDRAYYRPEWAEGVATHYQVYETVSEGTPVTPLFATKDELIEHLVAHGDSWDQLRGLGGWSREAAVKFVERAWSPSLVVETSSAGASVRSPWDGI